jgi:hypothetical protein
MKWWMWVLLGYFFLVKRPVGGGAFMVQPPSGGAAAILPNLGMETPRIAFDGPGGMRRDYSGSYTDPRTGLQNPDYNGGMAKDPFLSAELYPEVSAFGVS